MAIRSTLGASRRRLARQVLAESVVLAIAFGAAGLVVTWWSLPALIALVPDGLPRVDSIVLDPGVLIFAMAIAFMTSTVAGMAPAVSASHMDLSRRRAVGAGCAAQAPGMVVERSSSSRFPCHHRRRRGRLADSERAPARGGGHGTGRGKLVLVQFALPQRNMSSAIDGCNSSMTS